MSGQTGSLAELQFPCIRSAVRPFTSLPVPPPFPRAHKALWAFTAGYTNPAHLTSHPLAVRARLRRRGDYASRRALEVHRPMCPIDSWEIESSCLPAILQRTVFGT